MRTILETARLRLREMTLDDLDFLASLLGDPEVMRFFPKPLDRDESRQWIERALGRYAEHGHGHWLVLDRQTGEPLGQVGLILQVVDEQPRHEIGYLIHRPFWRHGYAAEAALGVRKWAFEEHDQEEVISLIRPENIPSQGVARKMGMAPNHETDWRGYRHLVFVVRREAATMKA